MKISKTKLKRIIKEEIINFTLDEQENLSESAAEAIEKIKHLSPDDLIKIHAVVQAHIAATNKT